MSLWIGLLLAFLEIHGLVGRETLHVEALPTLHHWGGTLLMNLGTTQGDVLVLRLQGTLMVQATQGDLPGPFGGAQVTPVEAWAPETLRLWHWDDLTTSGSYRQAQAWLALQAVSLEYRWRQLAGEIGRFPVALGLNPWFSVLDPFRLYPRQWPLLEYSGVDGLRWTLRSASSEGQVFWIPARSDTTRWGAVFHLYLPWWDAVGQVLRLHHETHWGAGAQGNLLEGVLRVEATWIQRPENPEGRFALQVSYSRSWEPGTLDATLLFSQDPRYLGGPGEGSPRWMVSWTTERERWGGLLGVDHAQRHTGLWAEAHYWLFPWLRVFALGLYHQGNSLSGAHASVGLSWYP